ncbi:MAG: tetratricopeptide repeat protein [Planctomycetaceae bacterium]
MSVFPASIKPAQVLVLPFLVLLSVSSVSAVDEVTRRSDNAKIRGEITKSDITEISVKRASGEVETIPVANVKSVVFDQEPPLLRTARTNETSGALEPALEKLKQVKTEYSGTNKILKADIDFLLARVLGKQALIDPDKAEEAIAALQAFRTANATSFRYLEATLLQATLHSARKEVDQGKELLSEVQKSPVKGYQLQAGVDLGRLLLTAGDAAGALSSFDDVISKSSGDESAAGALYDGLLGRAMCLKQQNESDQAITVLDDVIGKAPESETRTLAEAWLRKGDCLRQKNEPKAALMAYLHVDVLYPGEPAQHAEALKQLSELWGPSGHEDRAAEAAARLAEKYPHSQWAKQ